MFCPKCGTENPDNSKFCRSCGTNLGGVADAISGNLVKPNEIPQQLLNRKGKRITWESALTSLLMGFAFLGVAIALAITGKGQGWWFWMLIPSASMLGRGISQIIQIQKYEEVHLNKSTGLAQNQFPNSSPNLNLPPNQTEFIKTQGSIYETGELVERPPSVTEGTTKLLNKEIEQ